MKVYRVRHKRLRRDGKLAGPYRGNSPLHDELVSAHDGCDDHPFPSYDGISMSSEWYCAFESIEQLLTWFKGWVEKLAECGFEVAEYDVPEHCVQKGEYQVAFKMPARCRRRIPMEELLCGH